MGHLSRSDVGRWHSSPLTPRPLVGVWQEAQKLFKTFKRQIEQTDLALYKKDEEKADKLLQGAASSYSSWLEVVGISV